MRPYETLQPRTVGVAVAALTLAALILPGSAGAKPWWTRGVESNEGDFLDPDVPFHAASRVDGNVLHVRWVIADGYYLYRQRMSIKAESPDLALGEPAFPRSAHQNGSLSGHSGDLHSTSGGHRTLYPPWMPALTPSRSK